MGFKSLQWVLVNKNNGTKQKALVWYQPTPPEGQVSEWEVFMNSIVRELESFCVPTKKEAWRLYISKWWIEIP